jgi:hypothetical protein
MLPLRSLSDHLCPLPRIPHVDIQSNFGDNGI